MLANRIAHRPETDPPDVATMSAFHLAGWSVVEMGALDEDGRPAWVVTGSKGDSRVRAEGSTPAEAWCRALEQAQARGMIGRPGRKGKDMEGEAGSNVAPTPE